MSLSDNLLGKNFKVEKSEAIDLCKNAREYFSNQPNVLTINEVPESGVCVVGDIHGNDVDLVHVLNLHGTDDKTYIFLGDYIDRGMQSLRVIFLLFSLIAEKKSRIFCLRGNHETEAIANIYGFKSECENTYGADEGKEVFDAVLDACRFMPLCAVILKKYMCVHAGLSPHIKKISDLGDLDRTKLDLVDEPLKIQAEEDGYYKQPYPVIDILWGDPSEEKEGFSKSPRGVGYLFGADVTKKFCEENDIKTIIRSHQLVMEGAKFVHDKRVLTIFSASNYCGKCENKGGICIITQTEEIKTVTYKVTLSLDQKLNKLHMAMIQKKELDVTLEEVNEFEQQLDQYYKEKKDLVKNVREKLSGGGD